MQIVNESTVMVDMDGVLCNFAEGLAKIMNKPWPPKITKQVSLHEILEIESQSALYQIILNWERDNSRSFWTGLQAYPEASDILNMLKRCFRRVVVCSTPYMSNPYNAGKKILWYKRNVASLCDGVIITDAKHLIPLPLVDDYHSSADVTFRFPQPWNENWDIQNGRDKVDYLRGLLRTHGFIV